MGQTDEQDAECGLQDRRITIKQQKNQNSQNMSAPSSVCEENLLNLAQAPATENFWDCYGSFLHADALPVSQPTAMKENVINYTKIYTTATVQQGSMTAN